MSTALQTPNVENLSQAVQQSLGISHESIYKTVFEVLQKYTLKQGQLLDFGAGQGDFLKKLINKDFKFMCHGVDLMYSRLPEVNWYVQDLNKKLQFKDQQFDVVTCIEVIEHLENPRQMIRDLSRVLKKEGVLVITTPNNESWRSIISYIMRGQFVAFTDSSYPAHITALNQTDIYRILRENNFSRIEVLYTNSGMVPSLPSLTWQKISGGLFKGLRFSDNIVVVAQK
jgi:2-polyprenyl-3-methyl-5-hydroxy-6-metoxy-1,4-benzoquinol methylase